MPCNSDGFEPNWTAIYREKADLTTRLLCEILTSHPALEISTEARAWWDEHQRLDAERRLKEARDRERTKQAEVEQADQRLARAREELAAAEQHRRKVKP